MNNPYLIGERVYLAPVEMQQIDSYLTWLNDPEVTRYLDIRLPLSRLVEEEKLQNLIRDPNSVFLGINLRNPDKFIGGIGLHNYRNLEHKATFGIFIGDKTEWNKGYGTEATELIVTHGFMSLNLHRIELDVYDFNARGVRCYEKVGFVVEGRKREAIFRDGTYYDIIQMGILRSDCLRQPVIESAEPETGKQAPLNL